MNTTATVPDPATIRQRIDDCRQELAALKRLLRLSKAAQEVDAARGRRLSSEEEQEGSSHAS
jgi:hypothetical protein